MAAEYPNERIPPDSHFWGKWEWCYCHLWPVHPGPAFFNDYRRAEEADDDALFQGFPGGGGGLAGLVASCVFGSAGFGLGLAFVVFLEFFAMEFII